MDVDKTSHIADRSSVARTVDSEGLVQFQETAVLDLHARFGHDSLPINTTSSFVRCWLKIFMSEHDFSSAGGELRKIKGRFPDNVIRNSICDLHQTETAIAFIEKMLRTLSCPDF